MNKRFIQFAVGVATSAALAALLLRLVDISALGDAISVADLRLIPCAMAIHILAMWVRSLMWRQLLPSRPSTRTLFDVSIVGFAINYLMPIRVGELLRIYLVRRWCQIDSGPIIASLVAERTLDGLAVSAIMLIAVLLVPAPGYVLAFGVVIGAAFAALAIVLIIASWRTSAVVRLAAICARLLPRSMRGNAVDLAHGFATSLKPVGDIRALPRLLALAVAGWLCQFGLFYLVMFAFPLPASLPMALLGGGVANFATLLPSAPGAVGAFDAALIKLLVDVQQVPIETAAAYALLVHAVVVTPIVALGGFTLWRRDLSFVQVLRYATGARLNHFATGAEQPRAPRANTIRSAFVVGARSVAASGESLRT